LELRRRRHLRVASHHAGATKPAGSSSFSRKIILERRKRFAVREREGLEMK